MNWDISGLLSFTTKNPSPLIAKSKGLSVLTMFPCDISFAVVPTTAPTSISLLVTPFMELKTLDVKSAEKLAVCCL